MSITTVHKTVALGLGLTLCVVVAQRSAAQKSNELPPGVALPSASAVKTPLVPDWPGEIVGLLQEKKYAEARTAVDRLEAAKAPKDADTRAFHDLVRATSLRLEGKHAEAVALIAKRLLADPKTLWSAKLRGELAAANLAAGKPAEAHALARADVETLLGGPRKDALAEVYRSFARKLIEPTETLVAPDYAAARPYLTLAREVAQSTNLKNDLSLQIAQAALDQGLANEAVPELRTLLAAENRPERKRTIRFMTGLALLRTGDADRARREWTDLARSLEADVTKGDASAKDLRDDCLYAVALAYGLPFAWEFEPAPNKAATPVLPQNSIQNPARAIAAGEKAIANDPADPRAVRTAFAIGQILETKPAEALAYWNRFLTDRKFRAETDIARKDMAKFEPQALMRSAQSARRLEKFDDSQTAFREYAAKYPDGADSAAALQAIIDIEIDKADKLQRDKDEPGFRESVRKFVAANPLQPSVPSLLKRIGMSFEKEKKYAEAVDAWKVLTTRFPDHAEADHARYLTAMAYETKIGDLNTAIETYRDVRNDPWKSQASARIRLMENKSLAVITPKVFRTGEAAKLKISTRNIEKLTFTAYKIDPESYFRKKQRLGGVESLDIGLVKPDSEWTAEVPGQARYKPVDHEYELKSVPLPGVWVVKVTDDKTLQATTMVIGSDVDAIVKTSRDQLLVYVQEMNKGEARPGARVLVSDGSNVFVEDKTGADGVLLRDWPTARPNSAGHRVLVIDGPHVATTDGANVPAESARGLTAKGLILTDRPAYEPGQTVKLRGIIREVAQSRFETREGAVYTLEVADARGRRIDSRPVTISRFGTFSAEIPLDTAAPLGAYAVRLFRTEGSSFAGSFQVEEYELPKIVLELKLDNAIVERGEKVTGQAVARYSYGTPLADRTVLLNLPGNRTTELKTDAAGSARFETDTEDLDENGSYTIVAQLPEEGVGAAANFAIPGASFSATLSAGRSTYLADETIPLRIATIDALGKPTSQTMTLTTARRTNEDGRTVEQEVSRTQTKTDPATGKTVANVRFDDKRGGMHVIRLSGSDQFGRPVTAELVLEVSGTEDPNGLRLLADTTTWKLGGEASATLHARHAGGPALLCFEADRMLGYRIEKLKVGENRLTWKVADDHFPNLTVTATRMRERVQDATRLDIAVERGLTVGIRPLAGQVKPGEPVEAELTATDQNGRPAEAELSLALVDKALLRLFGDDRPDLRKTFYDQTRLGAFSAVSTNTFEYKPATVPVPESLVEEAERQMAQVANQGGKEQARRAVTLYAQGAGGMPGTPVAPAAMAPSRGESMAEPPESAAASDRMGIAGAMPGLARKDAASGRAKRNMRESLRDGEAKSELSEETAMFGKSVMGQTMNLSAIADMGGMGGMGGGGFEQGPARDRTVETAYWNASIITGKDGKARVRFDAPNALGEYEFKSYGVTAADTLLGEAASDLAVRKPFFVELNLPVQLNEGDVVRPVARLHHSGVKGDVAVALDRYADGRSVREPKTVKVTGDGVTTLVFDEFTVPATREIRFEATATSGNLTDRETVTVPAEPWGTPVAASRHGSARDDSTVFVELPAGRTYESLAMMVTVAPTLQRQVLEAALGAEVWPLARNRWSCVLPPIGDTTSDRAADLLATTSALEYLRQVGGSASAIDQARLVDRIRGLTAELSARQNDDGGWPVVAQSPRRLQPPQGPSASVPVVSAKAVVALAAAKKAGVADPGEVLNKGAAYVASVSAQARPWQAIALATTGRIGFEELNALHRVRQSLDSAELAALVLAWLQIERRPLADEAMTTLLARSRTLPAQPGQPVQRYWAAGMTGQEITTAWAAWALASVRPGDEALPESVAWLQARRFGPGWIPYETKGAAVAALAAWHGRAQGAEDRYRMTVAVNDKVLESYAVDGVAGAPVKVWNVPPDAIRPGRNKVTFDVEGRARFGYGVELTGFSRDYGPEQRAEGKPYTIARREWLAAEPELDGVRLPSGFSTVVNPKTFRNLVTQVPAGGKARVSLVVKASPGINRQNLSGDLIVVEDTLPSGARLVEGSVTGNVLRTEKDSGRLRFYLDPNLFGDSEITYEVFGAFEGRSKVRPTRVYRLGSPETAHASTDSTLTILPAGSKSTDPYEPTPDELYARGQRLFDKGRVADAAAALEALSAKYALTDPVIRETARMLLDAHILSRQPKKIVEDFEILKTKAADLVLSTEKIKAVGDAYAAIGEHERAWLVWRAVIDSGYLEDAQLAQTLKRNNRPLEAAAYLIDLWRSYPTSAGRQSDFFGLSRLIGQLAEDSQNDPETRRRLLAADVTRSQLLAQSVALTQMFLTLSPEDPLADEANLALLGDLAALDTDETVVRVAQRAARLFPKSRFLDSFQFAEALARFDLGQMDESVAIARKIAEMTYEEPGGVKRPSPNRNQALFIMAQIFDARGEFAQAIDRYREVQQEFPDAAVAIKALERKTLTIPEVTVVPTAPDAKGVKAKLELKHRNIATLDLKIYPVDLLRLYLSKRSLDKIDAVDLAGIRPLTEKTESLGAGKDFAEKSRELSLELPGEGAYLVMLRGGDLFASGIVLATSIDLEVMEDTAAGRVRVAAREVGTAKPLAGLQVKLSATHSPGFRDGATDLRGVFVQDGLLGQATIVVRQSAGRYAFFRGKSPLGGAMTQGFQVNSLGRPNVNMPAQAADKSQSLDQNLRGLNLQNSQRQMERLDQRFDDENRSRGVKVESVK
jgi:outer membrane protein assembly factor BamD (BamD/ComL family)